MDKKIRILAVFLVLLLLVVSAGCAATQKNAKDKNTGAEFVKSQDGLLMEFVKNYPGESYVVGNTDETISVVIDVRNKGTYGFEDGATDISGGGYDEARFIEWYKKKYPSYADYIDKLKAGGYDLRTLKEYTDYKNEMEKNLGTIFL